MKKYAYPLLVFMGLAIGGESWSAALPPESQPIADDIYVSAEKSSKAENQTPQSTVISAKHVISSDRLNPAKYYPPKTARTAMLFSAMLPGSGQTYAGHAGKGLVFLVASAGLLTAAGLSLDRAWEYDDLADRFTTGFYDPHGDGFLTADQGHVKSRSHAQLGAIFLAGGIGVYIWNIFDAAKTVDQYNERRFPVQVQQTVYGERYLTVTHHF